MNTQLLHYLTTAYEEVISSCCLRRSGFSACCGICLLTYTTLKESSARDSSCNTCSKPSFARLRLNSLTSFLMVMMSAIFRLFKVVSVADEFNLSATHIRTTGSSAVVVGYRPLQGRMMLLSVFCKHDLKN